MPAMTPTAAGPSALKAVVFDAYGTLLDVDSAMQAHASRLGPDWAAISTAWRLRQLQYSWIRSLAGAHRDFWQLTAEALAWAAAAHGITDQALLDDVLQAYRKLTPYPDVEPALRRLHPQGKAAAILSNGEPSMLADAVAHAQIGGLLDAVLSAEDAGVFKPDPRVYRLATARFGAQPGEIGFVSSNAWDAFGAARFGFRVFWLNRKAQPVEFGLETDATELRSLADLPDALA